LEKSKILVYENSNVFFEGDTDAPSCYLVLYGSVYLQTREAGTFMKCPLGDFLAEENLIYEYDLPR
jgi:hypothetical protein